MTTESKRTLMGALSVALILLSACGPTKNEQISMCQIQAYKTLGRYNGSGVDPDLAGYIVSCMNVHHYKFDYGIKGCNNLNIFPFNVSGCYKSRGY